jgi:carbon monoxide dehydrogenase subunit G
MASRLEVSRVVDKPVEEIFAFINIPENHTKFVPGMLEFRKTSPGPLGQVGATIQGMRRVLGQKVELPYEIIEFEQNKKLGMKGLLGPISFRDGYILDSMGSKTRITFWLEFLLNGVMNLAKPFLIPWGRLHGNETVTNLKKLLEKSG